MSCMVTSVAYQSSSIFFDFVDHTSLAPFCIHFEVLTMCCGHSLVPFPLGKFVWALKDE